MLEELGIWEDVPRLRSITSCLRPPYNPTLGRAAFKEIGPNELSRLDEHEVSEFPPKLDDWWEDLDTMAGGVDQVGWTEHSLWSLAASWN